ncbi:unnamed protein product [Lymnaea stagnalis]|uniref:GRIP domain-containing protein n=1 Tax=Lymnaea stagnalis TaxID=6523 RepID=A0AAV2HJ22_LYMST
MSWIGGSLSSLTGQLSNLTKDILTEGTEEVGDPTTELQIAKDKIQQLDSVLSSLKLENERLKRINKELEEKAESSELQINAISSQYRGVLENKEKEIHTLKQQYQELLEQHARTAALSSHDAPASDPSRQLDHHGWGSAISGGQDLASINYDGDTGDWDFDDSIRLQRENNKLRTELQHIQAQVKHWRSVAGQLGENAGQTTDLQTNNAQVIELQQKIKSFEAQLTKKTEELQQQAASLHDHHRQKVASLKSRHQLEISALQERLTSLEQQLTDARDGGSSSQHSGSGTLPESERLEAASRERELQWRLTQALQEKEKVQDENGHLETVLGEVQQEVERLRQELVNQSAPSDHQVQKLKQMLQESEVQRSSLEQQLANVTGELRNQLTQSLKQVKDDQEKLVSQTESRIEKLGDRDEQSLTTELLDTLERENLILKEEKLKYEEQITLLERAATTAASERQVLQTRVRELQTQVKRLIGEPGVEEDSDDTQDTDITSVTSSNKNSALLIGSEEIDRELARLREELQQQTQDKSVMDLERTDWLLEREALEDVITDLRQTAQSLDQEIQSYKSGHSRTSELTNEASLEKVQTLEAELSSLRTENVELENALEELDAQHSQALEQLINTRNQLSAQLSDRNKQIEEQQKLIQDLEARLEGCEARVEGHEARVEGLEDLNRRDEEMEPAMWQERCRQLQAEIEEFKNKTEKPSVSVETELSDLRQRLHKGGLVINDLHMDKRELQEQLKEAKEETATKVSRLKEMRESNVKLVQEKKDLQVQLEDMRARLSEMEEEVDRWQQVNEDGQLVKAKEHEECEKLKSQLAAVEKEKELFSFNFDQLLTEKPGQTDIANVEDSDFRKILEVEAKVRRQIDSDGQLIQDLKKQVQKLYEDKQCLKNELRELETFHTNYEEKYNQLLIQQQEILSDLELSNTAKADLELKLKREVESVEAVSAKLADAISKLQEAGRQNEDLSDELTAVRIEKTEIERRLESLQKQYDAYILELKASQELSAESLVAEHQKLLDSQRLMKMEIDELQGQVKNTEDVEAELEAKKLELEGLKKKSASFDQEMSCIKSDIARLEGLCAQKDHEIEELKSRMAQFDQDFSEIEESVSISQDQHKVELRGKENELDELRRRNLILEQRLGLMEAGTQMEHKSSSDRTAELEREILELKKEMSGERELRETISQLESELALCNNTIAKLHQDLSMAHDTIHCREAGIADINQRVDEQRRALDQSVSDATRQACTIAVPRQTSVDKETMLNEIKAKLTFLITLLTPQQMEKLKNYSLSQAGLPALEYVQVRAIEFSDSAVSAQSHTMMDNDSTQVLQVEDSESQTTVSDRTDSALNGYIVDEDFDSTTSDHDRCSVLEREMDELRSRLKEKDSIVAELQKSNKALLSLLEKGGGDWSSNGQLVTHKLEADLRNLRAEKEQIMAVVTEKSRENSNLKSENHRLMGEVAAGLAALAKLQGDNRQLEQRQNSPARDDGEDEMRREALANLARLVRDRETEIDALKQKNETLLAVLQSSGESQAATHLAPLLKDREHLSQQVAALTSERAEFIACVTNKHSECLAYHAESQRLAAQLSETQAAYEKVSADYASLIPNFDDKTRALSAAQQELVKCKQRLSDLEVRHGELIQRSNSQDTPNSSDLSSLEDELQRLRHTESDLRLLLSQRDEKVQIVAHRVSALEEELTARDSECAHLRKQLDNSKFQLTGLMSEMADMRAENQQIHKKNIDQDSESASLLDAFNQMTLDVKEKESNIRALRDQVATLTSLLHEKQGEQGHITKLMKDNETALTFSRQLQQERDHHAMLAEQRLQQCNVLRSEVAHLKDKESKLMREVERLRHHLMEIEDGYTKEAVEAEEREKDLRNKLAIAEEHALSSSSRVDIANQESSRHIESLQQQLQHAQSQRDAAYMEVANIQEQCSQYASSLSNLQLVLEHFQKGDFHKKDVAIASETEHLESECQCLRRELQAKNQELTATKDDLVAALDGLEAASRLSEQLDRKEEALAALKEEVLLREKSLQAAEEEIHKLSSNREAKVDKTLMHNMVMTWLTSPESKRMEIVHLIGNILSFSDEDFQKIETAQGKGSLLSGIFRRTSHTPPVTPVKPTSGNQSFSQLFVKFLEKESSPPPSPVRLPAEAMAAEAQHRHKTPFNPFMAPRHVTHDGQRSSSPSSHLLISNDMSPIPSPFFTPLTSSHSSSESAILKDVLGKR